MARRAYSLLSFRRNPILFAAALMALAVPTFGQAGAARPASQNPTQDIAGTWQGTIHAGMDMRVVAAITRAGNGEYKALFYGIDQNEVAVSPYSITFQGGTVKWAITGGGSYEGKLSADGETVEGSWRLWGPSPFPVTMTRIPPEAAKKLIEELSQLQAPPANANLAFAVASIRPSKTAYMSVRPRTDGISIAGATLWQLLFSAYNVPGISRINREDQVSGLPGWAQSDTFDIEAKMDEETLSALQKLPLKEQSIQRQFMMQALLADRFKLQIHRETKETPIDALVVAKGDFKLKESQAIVRMWSSRDGRITITAGQIDDLVFSLTGDADRTVVNKTGLTGKYDIDLKWTPDDQQGTPDAGPTLFTALEEQLGLKLVPAKGPVDTFVVDHVERPTEN
jgi:uncharacterized protein (TIGR03435 family)